MIMALLALAGLVAAGRMHWRWITKLNSLADDINGQSETEVEHWNVPFGTRPRWLARTSSVIPAVLALAFVVGWLVLLFDPPSGFTVRRTMVDCVFLVFVGLSSLTVLGAALLGTRS